MIYKGKDTEVELPEELRYDPPHWRNLLRNAVKLREHWKLYAIALREQNERLENYADGVKIGQKEIRDDADFEGCYDFDAETLELEIEKERMNIEVLRHGVVAAGDGD